MLGRLLIAFSLMTLFLPQSLWAIEAVGTSVDFGPGATTCKVFSKKSTEKKFEYVLWTQGFLSAFNAMDPETKNIMGERNHKWLLDWLKNYCDLHPEENFGLAVRNLIDDLYPTRITATPPEGLGIKNPEKLTPEQAQSILSKIKIQ